MAEKKPNYIPFFFDDIDALDELGDAERGRLLTSLLKYGETGAAEKLCGNERFVYKMFCGRIDRFFESYENKCRKNRANVSKRYEATDEYDCIRTNTTVCEELPKLPSKSKSKYNPNPNNPPVSPFEGEMKTVFEEWLSYKHERREDYKDTGLKSLTTQLQNSITEFGETAVIKVIRDSMSSGYKGIMFDRLKKTGKKNAQKHVAESFPSESDEEKMARLQKLAERMTDENHD